LTTELTQQIIESHYLETTDHLFFAVKGLVHPPDRFLACLRYAPDPTGDRQKGRIRYRRLYHFDEQEQLLQEHYPHYLAFDPVCQVTLQSVPRAYLQRVYDPRTRLRELRQQSARDAVEEDAVAFAKLLQQEADIPWDGLGLSGSPLIGLHTPHSDLDLTVYGEHNSWAVHRALRRLLEAGSSEARHFDAQGIEALYAERVPDTRMTFSDFVKSEQHKVFQGQFRGRLYFIRFLKEPGESAESYGDRVYTPLGQAGIEATVTDASEAIFTPCRYPVANVRSLGNNATDDLVEIVSFRGRFCEQAQAGDIIRASGTLEQVKARDGRVWTRLLLGNHRDDVMLVQG